MSKWVKFEKEKEKGRMIIWYTDVKKTCMKNVSI